LEVDAEEWQAEAGASFRLAREGERFRLLRREPGGGWERQYVFSLRPRRLADFEEGSRFHQTSPESPFTTGRICSLATAAGRVTLAGRRLIVTEHGERTERELVGEEEYRAVLRERFGIDLER
jgi:N-hydroxyarylamine O-acetyltransferase